MDPVKVEETKQAQSAPATTAPQASGSVQPQNPQVAQEQVKQGEATATSMAGRRRSSGVLDELKQLQKDVKEFRPSDLIIPIMSIIILALLTIFVYIPMISKAIEFRNESKVIDEKISKLSALEGDLNRIDAGLLQTDLADARKVIPFSLQVSDFVQYINDLADRKNLEFRQILAGDIQIRTDDEKKDVDPVVRGVNGPLKYSGKLTSIVSFLDELQSVSPYIISSDNIEIEKIGTDDDWEISLITTGYYMNKESLPKVNIYAPFAAYSQFSIIMDTFRQKSENTE